MGSHVGIVVVENLVVVVVLAYLLLLIPITSMYKPDISTCRHSFTLVDNLTIYMVYCSRAGPFSRYSNIIEFVLLMGTCRVKFFISSQMS